MVLKNMTLFTIEIYCFSVNISDIAVTIIKTVDYCFIIHNNKSEAINLLESSVLEIVDIFKKYCLNF